MPNAASRTVRVADESAVPEGAVVRCQAEGKALAVVHSQGHWYAIEDRCSHDDGPLSEGEAVGAAIECPRHGARFSLESGKALTPPAVLSVAIFSVTIADGGVYVEMP